jgi:5'(3')-deoxyribonucleotidase
MRVLVDMDEIIVDLLTTWIQTINERFGLKLTRNDIRSYKMQDHVPSEYGQAVENLITEPGFFGKLNPLPGAIESIRILQNLKDIDLKICTHPAGKYSAFDKYEWCHKYLGLNHHNVIMTTEKHFQDADIIVDDSPKVLNNRRRYKPETKCISIEYPYNKDIDGVIYVGTWQNTKSAWSNIVDIIKNMMPITRY